MDLFITRAVKSLLGNMIKAVESWGRLKYAPAKEQIALTQKSLPEGSSSMLAYGNGRSYGDSCLNSDQTLLLTEKLDKFIHFDSNTGRLRCQGGVSLDEILKVFVPKGWFLPVVPGTKFITVGGAIANDVHGKNQHIAGNFGNHVLSLKLLRSNGQELECSANENTDFFKATIGGLGLTGLIYEAEIQLKPIKSAMIDQEQIKFNSLEQFLRLSEDSYEKFEYTVAWFDCTSNSDVNGIYIRGNHAETGGLIPHADPKLVIPLEFPNWLLNKLTVKAFNILYYHKNIRARSAGQTHYEKFFFPLDSIKSWNRIYGSRGFYQYQFVIPGTPHGIQGLNEIIKEIKSSGSGSFLSVLKTFGDVPPAGIMSFPQKGLTLALDFPNNGQKILELFTRCDAILQKSGGRIYPAKDARMDSEFFQRTFNIKEFSPFIDPKFKSNFSRRMNI